MVYELQEQYSAEDSELQPDGNAELASYYEIQSLETTLKNLGHQVLRIGDIEQLVQFISAKKNVDLIFNYAAGMWGQTREAQIPALLEAFRIPYTGSEPFTLSLCLDKAVTKRLWQHAGLPTPAFCVIADSSELDQKIKNVSVFPVFVKPVREGSSKGICADALVNSHAKLYEHVSYMLAKYRQPVMIETYLPGREFTVGILGDGEGAGVIGVAEICLASKQFVDILGKKAWQTHSFLPVETVTLRNELAELARQAYLALNCQSLARVDIRLDQDGQPGLLEINPNPGLHPIRSALPAIGRQAGLSYEALLAEILHLAVRRAEGLSEKYVIDTYLRDTKNSRGLGVFAGRRFKTGEVIVRATGRIIPVQTEYSIQIGWDRHLDVDSPARHMNHSCEPNTGVKTNEHGFPEFVALRDIQEDEEITWDYAMTEFTHYKRSRPELEFDLSCYCGSKNCRGKLGYYSELSDELKEKYKGFIADYLVHQDR